MTYSIVARDAESGQIGVAVQSRYFSVGSVVTWAETGVGAVATQSLANPDYGPEGIALMRAGRTAQEALDELVARDPGRDVRQVAMIDATGIAGVHTGPKCIAAAGHLAGAGFTVQANLMTDDTIWPAMKSAFESATGDLAERMFIALEAAQAAGGDVRGQQSAAILVVAGERMAKPWEGRVLELRVEDHARPLEELRRLLGLWRAYRYVDKGDDLVAASKLDEAMDLYHRALEQAPHDDQIQFFAAIALFRAGREDEALALFRQAFATTPGLSRVVDRLVPLGMVPDDPAVIARILSAAN